jgi:hypothetical protein
MDVGYCRLTGISDALVEDQCKVCGINEYDDEKEYKKYLKKKKNS